jgi:hypothetical protein
MIKDKITPNDKDKARLFMSKLQDLAAIKDLKIDQFTLHRIEQLLIKREEV